MTYQGLNCNSFMQNKTLTLVKWPLARCNTLMGMNCTTNHMLQSLHELTHYAVIGGGLVLQQGQANTNSMVFEWSTTDIHWRQHTHKQRRMVPCGRVIQGSTQGGIN